MSKKIAALTSTATYFYLVASAYAQGAPLVSAGPGFVSAGTGNENDVSKVTSTVVNLLFIVASALAVIYLIMGGIRWITSRGDKAGVEAARKQIVAAIIGLIVVAGAFFILNVVFKILGVTNPTSGFTLPTLQ